MLDRLARTSACVLLVALSAAPSAAPQLGSRSERSTLTRSPAFSSPRLVLRSVSGMTSKPIVGAVMSATADGDPAEAAIALDRSTATTSRPESRSARV